MEAVTKQVKAVEVTNTLKKAGFTKSVDGAGKKSVGKTAHFGFDVRNRSHGVAGYDKSGKVIYTNVSILVGHNDGQHYSRPNTKIVADYRAALEAAGFICRDYTDFDFEVIGKVAA